MPLKEIDVDPGPITVLPRAQEIGYMSVAVMSAFESHLRAHPVDLGPFTKAVIRRGAGPRRGPVPPFCTDDRIAWIQLPGERDDLVGQPRDVQAEMVLDALVDGICVVADHTGSTATVHRIADLVRADRFRTLVTERRRNRARTRYGIFEGVIDLERTVLTLTATDARTDEVVATQERRFRADHWSLTQYARALRWDSDELVIRTKEFTSALPLHWRMRVP